MLTTDQKVDRILAGYIDAVLQCETDESDDSGGVPLSQNFNADDFHVDSQAKMRRDCRNFCEASGTFIDECGLSYEDIGVNFYLDRQGHGDGFLYREDESKSLTEAHACRDLHEIARGWPKFYVWIGDRADYGDDDKLHGEIA